jgi:hypothetical protein
MVSSSASGGSVVRCRETEVRCQKSEVGVHWGLEVEHKGQSVNLNDSDDYNGLNDLNGLNPPASPESASGGRWRAGDLNNGL